MRIDTTPALSKLKGFAAHISKLSNLEVLQLSQCGLKSVCRPAFSRLSGYVVFKFVTHSCHSFCMLPRRWMVSHCRACCTATCETIYSLIQARCESSWPQHRTWPFSTCKAALASPSRRGRCGLIGMILPFATLNFLFLMVFRVQTWRISIDVSVLFKHCYRLRRATSTSCFENFRSFKL